MEKILVIDSSSLIHRAYYAVPELSTKSGELVNATYGFFSLLMKSIEEFKPDYVVTTFDLPVPTFRHEKFKEYKATRPKTPEDLALQIPRIKEGVHSFDIPILEKEGFEADDIIGSVVLEASKNSISSLVVSGDMDILQLVDEKVSVYLFKRGINEAGVCDVSKVEEIYKGLKPSQLIDYKSLKGDASDNIPGVPGIGEKTAGDLIKKFNSLENIYKKIENKEEVLNIKKGVLEKLKENKETAFLSKELVTIRKDVPLKINIDDCKWRGYNDKGVNFFEKMGLNSLVNRVQKKENLSLF